MQGTATESVGAGELHMCVNPSPHYVVGASVSAPGGTYRYDPDTGDWQHWGAADASITGLAFDPGDPARVYTSAQNGLWCSTDAGLNWTITTSWRINDPHAVTVDPGSPAELYLALPDGVAYSPDRGTTWLRREEGLPRRGRYTQTVAVDRTRPGHAFAGCESGLYASWDAGRSWWLRIPTSTTVTRIVQDWQDPLRWFATTETDGLWSSADAGTSWRRIVLPQPTGTLYDTSVCAAHPGLVAVVDHDHGVWLSHDGGQEWWLSAAGLPERPVRAHRIGAHPDSGRLFLATYGAGLYVSGDAGASWSPAGMSGADVRSFTGRSSR